jgi:hypothetical protein
MLGKSAVSSITLAYSLRQTHCSGVYLNFQEDPAPNPETYVVGRLLLGFENIDKARGGRMSLNVTNHETGGFRGTIASETVITLGDGAGREFVGK